MAYQLFVVFLVAACTPPPDATGSVAPTPMATESPHDAVAEILGRGKLLLPVDPEYPPASFAVAGAQRRPDTRCTPNELTETEVDGYDVAIGKLVAEDLGVEPCFVTPSWAQLIEGHWAGRWDIAFSSIGITRQRMEHLLFTRPYYATPERFYVRAGGTTTTMEELSGQRIGVCTGCFADLYLRKTLEIPGESVDYRVSDADIIGYAVERSGLQDVATGTLDAFLCQETAGQQAIDEGLDLRALEPAAYSAFPAGAIDRSSGSDPTGLLDRVNQIIVARLADGTLQSLSMKYFGIDYATEAAAFDYNGIGQLGP